MTGTDDAPGDPAAAQLGERLAAWLEGLGLTAHLAEAGLPTVRRDADGRAVWSDPGTGHPLTLDQLEQLEGLLRSEGSEPEHAVPVQLVQLARRARVHEELLASESHTYETLAALRGTSPDATRFAVHKAAEQHRLLVVAAQERTLVPAFQLTSAGAVRAELVPLLEALLGAGMDGWDVWAWLARPVVLLGGLVPEQAAADPEHADLARLAADRLAARARG